MSLVKDNRNWPHQPVKSTPKVLFISKFIIARFLGVGNKTVHDLISYSIENDLTVGYHIFLNVHF